MLATASKQIDFTKGSILKSMILFSLPILMGELLQNLYNSVDVLVVGNLVGETALAAVSVDGTIANMVISFFNGMSIGANVVVSRAFGGGENDEISRKITAIFSFSVLLGVLISLLGIFLSPALLALTGAREEYYAEALIYLRIYLAGIMSTVIYNNGAGILRAVGDSATPFRILAVSCCINIVLDILLVGAFHLGVAGVGLATVFSQSVSVIMIYFAINRNRRIQCIDFRLMLHSGGDAILPLLRVGLTAGVQSALIGFSNILVVRYMNLFDALSVAGIGVAERLDKFIVLPAKSFGVTMTTFIGQNAGSGHYERMKQGKITCLRIALCVTVGLSLVFFLLTAQIVRLFNPNPTVVTTGVEMMRLLLRFFWVMAVREIYLGILRGYGENTVPMLLCLIGMIGCRQTFLAVTMHSNPAITNIYYCYPVAWIATTILLLGYYLCKRNNMTGM